MFTTLTLDPTDLLRRAGILPSTTTTCPECHRAFTAMQGVRFPVCYGKGSLKISGPVLFCSTTCILSWHDPRELNKC